MRVADRYTDEALREGMILFYGKRANWLLLCGVMPWNWFNRDIWTALAMAERELVVLRRLRGE